MRNISFMLTTKQIENRTKTVTRRLGWWDVEPGKMLQAVEKGMGLKRGEKVRKLAEICVVYAIPQRLGDITQEDVALEGFPEMTPDQFVEMFCKAHASKGITGNTIVNRIEFEYVD